MATKNKIEIITLIAFCIFSNAIWVIGWYFNEQNHEEKLENCRGRVERTLETAEKSQVQNDTLDSLVTMQGKIIKIFIEIMTNKINKQTLTFHYGMGIMGDNYYMMVDDEIYKFKSNTAEKANSEAIEKLKELNIEPPHKIVFQWDGSL